MKKCVSDVVLSKETQKNLQNAALCHDTCQLGFITRFRIGYSQVSVYAYLRLLSRIDVEEAIRVPAIGIFPPDRGQTVRVCECNTRTGYG